MRKEKKRPVIVASVILIAGGFFFFLDSSREERFSVEEKAVVIIDDGIESRLSSRTEKTVEELLRAEDIALTPTDIVVPLLKETLAPGTRIQILRSRPFTVRVDGGTKEFSTQARTVGEALSDAAVHLEDDDILEPGRETLLTSDLEIKVTRVEIREEVVERPIAFSTKTEEDDELSWRTKKVKVKGVPGVRTITYRVSYHDGKEVGRKQLSSIVSEDPVTEVIVQGTHVEVGKKHTGFGTWYAHTGTMAAASPWLPMGSYARVTNVANGQSVIVVINDRGPFGPNRIIDLDKVAFEKIASLGAGVIEVKVEEITN